MIKPFTVFVSIVVVVAGALFFPQIVQAFHGMSILEAMQQAVGFVLHVIVVSILAYGLYMVNELVQPWIKTFRQKQRHLRRSIRGRRSTTTHVSKESSAPRASRKDASLLRLIEQLAQDHRNQQKRSDMTSSSKDHIHWS